MLIVWRCHPHHRDAFIFDSSDFNVLESHMSAFGFSSRHVGKGKSHMPQQPVVAAIVSPPHTKIATSLSLEKLPADVLLRESQLVKRNQSEVAPLPFSKSKFQRNIAGGTWTKPIKWGERMSLWPVSECLILRAAHLSGKSEVDIKALVIQLHAKRQQLAMA